METKANHDDTPAGVTIDIVDLGTAEQAVPHVDEVMLGDEPTAFETDLEGDFVATMSFASDEGFGGSAVVLRDGPVAIAVVAAVEGATEMEAASEAIALLVQSRIQGHDAGVTADED